MSKSPLVQPARSVLESVERRSLADASPSLRPRGPRQKKLRSRPPLKRLASATNKLVFSVDDDINDAPDDNEPEEESHEKKYFEGYKDALRDLITQRKNKLIEVSGGGSIAGSGTDIDGVINQAAVESLEEEQATLEGLVEENGDSGDNASVNSGSSLKSMESLDLKARQEAINSTHPFGIKIWKPSVYKKIRSVAARAEEDIHDYDPRRPTGPIYFGIHLTNFLWSCTFGLLLFTVCIIGAVLVFIFTGFAWHKSLRPYVRLLVQLGQYWFHPFGKFVLLNKDENYLDEDEMDGRSISEFHQWRLEEEGRLFFAPPRRMTNSESKPLLKDHKGRPWREAYAAMGEGQSSGEQALSEEQNSPRTDEDENENNDIKVRFFGRGRWSFGRLLFYLFFYGILQPILFLIAVICWFFVFTIPMFNLNSILCDHLRRRPLALYFEQEKEYYKKISDKKLKKKYRDQSIILCTYRCCGLHYYKYTLGGTNIFFINLLSVVVFVILDYYLLKEGFGWKTWYTDSSFLFCGCLFSIIPLAYFIGQAVASISTQSSMGVGAVINAFFSTVVEIFLYCVALNQSKGKLVEGSMIGSVLGGVLLLPGLSMCGGALKRKTQRYNPRSAGVSSTMLLYAMVTMFTPSLFYQLYGSYEIRCKKCAYSSGYQSEGCTTCQFIQPSLILDNLYYKVLRPFSLFVAIALFVAYVVGLYFTLKTHASLIWATNSHELVASQARKESLLRSPSVISLDAAPKISRPVKNDEQPEGNASRSGYLTPTPKDSRRPQITPRTLSHPRNASLPKLKDDMFAEEEGDGGHDAPNWSNTRSYVILLGSTLLYAIIAEILVNNVDAVLSHYPINPKFLGLTVFALVPNTTEFVNAISFAVSGNVALSMEIGSAYALQVVLIQIPSLVVYSIYKGFVSVDSIFSLIFPRWDVVATLVSIYLFTYIYAEGKSNYFKGVILILIYIVVLVGFYLDDVVASLEDSSSIDVITRILSR